MFVGKITWNTARTQQRQVFGQKKLKKLQITGQQPHLLQLCLHAAALHTPEQGSNTWKKPIRHVHHHPIAKILHITKKMRLA